MDASKVEISRYYVAHYTTPAGSPDELGVCMTAPSLKATQPVPDGACEQKLAVRGAGPAAVALSPRPASEWGGDRA